MAFITDILNTIKNAHKGKDMRQAIYDGIQQCYEDATGHPDSVAAAVKKIGEVSANLSKETADRKAEVNTERKRIDNLIKELPATAGEYQQSKLVLHSYDNAAVKCTTTSGNYTNVPAFTTDQGGPLSSLYTKKSNYQIAVNKSGLYLFELRIHVNSLIANKRVELAPFVNDTRIAALASSYNTAGNFTLTQVAALPLWLSANDTVDFRIAPIEAAEVSLQLGDVLVYAIDWEDKFKIPDYTGYAAETKDIRTGADGTVYGTAGEAVRKQIGNITEDLADVTIQAQSSNVYDKDNPDMTFEGNIDATGKPVASTGRMTMIVPCEAGHTYSFVKLNTLKTGYINQSTRFSQYTKDGTFNEFLSNNALKTVTPTIDGFLYVMGGNVGFNQMVLKDWDGVIPTEYIEYKKSLLLNSERLNIPIPTRVSELENDSNYVKSNELPSVNEILESFYSSNVYNKDNSDAYIEDYMLTSDGALTQYVGRRVVKVPVNYGDTVCFYTLNSSKTTFGAVATRIAMYTEDGTNLGILSNNDKKMVTINNSSCKYAYISLSNDEQKEKGMIFINLGNVSATFTQYIPYYKRTVVKAENISSQWHGKKWLAYGDSITAISNGEMSCGWARYVTDVLNFGEFYGRGIGGQTYTWNDYTFYANNDGSYNSRDTSHNPPIGTTEHRGCFSSWDRIKTMIPDSIADTIDMIFLMGGTNDINGVEEVGGGSVIEYEIPIWSATNTTDTDWVSSTQYNGGDYDVAKFSGAIASTIMKLQTRCPNAIIVIGTPFSRWSNKLNLEIKGKTMFDVAEVEMKVARFMSMPHIDVNGFCGVNGFNSTEYQPDGVHPKTEKGMKMLGRTIIGGLRGIDPIIQ